ncbi:DUF7146 domain-containing protein [Minwuia thermotolerans]|uniref:Zinc finger CHC2-type domain-containing protein n=1 Tax=Minwuia thermotolerans TaxID=2056226 RepID=A0A2M9G2L8_9PROT|nr:CHC2 zinc finger domain-containing protein [Minwuia thermotolerans]PJK29940.1 hypothetical protein CVT23_09230 [Minwuia thermotolerans]
MAVSPERQALAEEVRRRVALVELVGRDVPLKRRGGDHWACCPFHSERSPSFKVSEARGDWHCFGCGAHGDCFGWIMARRGVGFAEALDELADLVGLAVPASGAARDPLPPVAERKSRAAMEADDRAAIERARAIWASGRPIAGTRAESYLRARGITIPLPPTLRYHPALRYTYELDPGSASGAGERAPRKYAVHGVYPAMLAAMQNAQGIVVGVHRTYLAPDGDPRKADDLPPDPLRPEKRLGAKKMAGRPWGGAIRLCPAAPRIGLGEGIETALSVMQAAGRPVWAAGSRGNFAAVDLPETVEAVDIYADGERAREDARKVMAKAARFHQDARRRMRVHWAPEGFDFNDVLMGRWP